MNHLFPFESKYFSTSLQRIIGTYNTVNSNRIGNKKLFLPITTSSICHSVLFVDQSLTLHFTIVWGQVLVH